MNSSSQSEMKKDNRSNHPMEDEQHRLVNDGIHQVANEHLPRLGDVAIMQVDVAKHQDVGTADQQPAVDDQRMNNPHHQRRPVLHHTIYDVSEVANQSKNSNELHKMRQTCQETNDELKKIRKVMDAARKEVVDFQKEQNLQMEKYINEYIENLGNHLKGVEENAKKKVEELQKEVGELQERVYETERACYVTKKLYGEQSAMIIEKDILIDKLERQLDEKKGQNTLSLWMKRKLIHLQDEFHRLRSENHLQDVNYMEMMLNKLSIDESVKRWAYEKRITFYVKFDEYQKAIETNIERIQSNFSITEEELLDVPDDPTVIVAELKEKLKEAEEVNERMGRECLICKIEKEEEDILYRCRHCTAEIHFECMARWMETHTTCPVCRLVLRNWQAM